MMITSRNGRNANNPHSTIWGHDKYCILCIQSKVLSPSKKARHSGVLLDYYYKNKQAHRHDNYLV